MLENPTHTYTTPGHYTVSLTAYSGSGDVTETKTDFMIVLELGAPVIINEFVASNMTGLQDEDGDYSDWIELYNASDTSVSLLGWAITDDEFVPGRFLLPNESIAPGDFLIVFASGKDRAVAASELHTNFKLNADGEYLALVQDPGIPTIAHEYPEREQRSDISFGLVDFDGGLLEPEVYAFMEVPTPGATNDYDSAKSNEATPPSFSHIHGHYDLSFNLSISGIEAGVQIYYTDDGSLRNEIGGTLYTVPIPITENTVIRAITYAPDHIGSRVTTATYIIGSSTVQKNLPTLAVVGDPDTDFWGPNGILYDDGGVNNSFVEHGRAWERKISLEFFDPLGAESSPELIGFQQDAGIRIHGSKGRREGYLVAPTIDDPWDIRRNKKSFRYYFRDSYGDGRLDYPLIPDSNVSGLKHVVMRAGNDDHENPFIKDEMSRRLMAQMGTITAKGSFVHFFLNGYFKGYFNTTERYTLDFFQRSHASDFDWDIIKGTDESENDRRELVEGDWVEWLALRDYIGPEVSLVDLTNPSNYATLESKVDIDNLIDYLILETYGANVDWPQNNWYMARERSANPELNRWRFYIWDMEMCYYELGDPSWITVDQYSDNPFHLENGWTFLRADGVVTDRDESPLALLYQALRLSPTFQAAWEARAIELFGPDGVLSTANVQAQFNELYTIVNPGMSPQTMNTFIHDTWAVERPAWLLYWFTQEGLMPTSLNADSDIDGLTGIEEILLGSDPDVDDTDGDGLTDGEEVNTHLTDPLDADTDDDGINDGSEIDLGTDPDDDQDVPSSSTVWVNFSYNADTELGSESQPFNSLNEGAIVVDSSGTVNIEAGDSTETLTITKPMSIEAQNGTVRIGM